MSQRLDELMRAADPARIDLPSATGESDDPLYLAILEKRGDVMAIDQQTKPTHPARRRSRGLLLAAAAFAIVLLVGLGIAFLGGFGGDEPVPVTDPPDPEAAEVVVVTDAIAAWNAGNLQEWSAHFDPDSNEIAREIWNEILIIANHTYELTGPCELGTANVAVVTCPMVLTNDFLGPAGIVTSADMEFVLTDEVLIDDISQRGNPSELEEYRYLDAFYTWLEETHPAVYAQIEPENVGDWPGAGNDPAHMAIALEYVDEFIAQSDDYPLEP